MKNCSTSSIMLVLVFFMMLFVFILFCFLSQRAFDYGIFNVRIERDCDALACGS